MKTVIIVSYCPGKKRHVFHPYQKSTLTRNQWTLSLHYMAVVLPIARDTHLRQNLLVNIELAFT